MKKTAKLLAFLLALALCLSAALPASAQEGPVQPDFEYGTGFRDLPKEKQEMFIRSIIQSAGEDEDPSQWTVTMFSGQRAYFAGIPAEIYEWTLKHMDEATPFEQRKIKAARAYAVSHGNGHCSGWGMDGSYSCSYSVNDKVLEILPWFHELFPLEWEQPSGWDPQWDEVKAAEEAAQGDETVASFIVDVMCAARVAQDSGYSGWLSGKPYSISRPYQ